MAYKESCLDSTMLPEYRAITDTSLVLEPSCVNKSWFVLYQFYPSSSNLKHEAMYFANTVLRRPDFEFACTCFYKILLLIPEVLLSSFSGYYAVLIATLWFNRNIS